MIALTDVELGRICSKIRVDEHGCWIWTAATNGKGYGCYSLRGRRWLTHRLVQEVVVGPIPAGHQVDHLCAVRRCCSPMHTQAVTGAENHRRQDLSIWQARYPVPARIAHSLTLIEQQRVAS